MLITQDKVAKYRNDPQSWNFSHTFDPPINIKQALIIYGLFIWQGNRDVYDTYLPQRFQLSLLRMQRYLSDMIDFAREFDLAIGAPFDIMNSHSELFNQKVEENFMSIEEVFDAYGGSEDGYLIGLDLSNGRVSSDRFTADVVALFNSEANRAELEKHFKFSSDLADHELYSRIKRELDDRLVAKGASGDE